MNEGFLIPLNGLGAGKKKLFWHVGKEFFADSEILDADITADVTVEKSGSYIGIDCMLDGSITVPCDRCLEDLEIPVAEDIRLSVKFGGEPVDMNAAGLGEDGRETVYLPEDEASLDMAQIIFDYSMLALPLQRVHPDGECNPEAMKWIVTDGEMPSQEEAEQKETDNPFAALKGLFSEQGLQEEKN